MANFRRGGEDIVKPGSTLLVDGNNLLMRAVKLLEARDVDMSAHEVNTGPLVIFANTLTSYVRDIAPLRLVVCWDGGRSAWRMSRFPGYKANRGPRPDSEKSDSTFGLAKEFLSLSNVHHVCLAGVEADDVIAHYWESERSRGPVTILSGDKDFLQLVEGDTVLVQPSVPKHWTHERIQKELECEPWHLPSVKALTGDSSDCIPGLLGFGHKTAIKALAAHDWDLEALLVTEDEKWKKKVEGKEEQARINRDLMNLRNQPQPLIEALPLADLEPIPTFEPTGMTGLLWSDLVDFLRRYELASIESRLRDERLWRNS